MWPVATYTCLASIVWSVYVSVCLLVTTKLIDMPFGVWARRSPMNIVLGGARILPQKGAFL